MASLFGITGADLVEKISPASGSYVFSVGDGGDLTEAAAIKIVEGQEAKVIAWLRPKYQKLLTAVDGEWATRHAVAGQSTVSCGLVPVVEGSLKVWRNFGDGAWSERRLEDAEDEDEWELDAESGVVTLVRALSSGESVILEYEHGAAAQVRALKEIVLDKSVAEIARRFSYFRSAEGFERFDQWERAANEEMRLMAKVGAPWLVLFEDLELVNETRARKYGGIFGRGRY